MKIPSFFIKNKSERQTVFKNSFWLSASMIFENLVRFLIMVWIARHYGPSNYGILMFVLSFVTFFSAFSDIGLSNLTIREISKDASLAKIYTKNITALKIVLGTITYAFMILAIYFLTEKDMESVTIAIFLGLYTIINSFSVFFQSFFRASQKMELEALSRSIQNLSLFVIVFFIISRSMSLANVSIAFFVSAMIGFILSVHIIKKYYSNNLFEINIPICKEIIKKAWPFGFSLIAASVYETFDSILLGITRSKEEVGLYAAAYKIAFITTIFASVIISSFFPLLSKKYNDGLEEMKNTAEKLSRAMLIFAWPLFIALLAFSDSIIISIYGDVYSKSVFVFQILIVSKISIYFTAIFGQIMQAAGRQKSHFKIIGKGALISVVLNLALTPTFGINGAAAASLVTSIFILLKMRTASKQIISVNNIKNSVIPVASSMGMLPVIYLTSFSFIYKAIICAMTYFVLLFLMIKFSDKPYGTHQRT